jgi:RimJ/RimL family protein N-acetyltransferase
VAALPPALCRRCVTIGHVSPSDRFHTDRLVATRLRETDLGELCRMHQDAEVMATLGGLRSDDRTKKFVDTNLRHWDDHGFGLWVFRAASTLSFVGRGGLRHVHIAGHDEIELAYALMPAFWGRGLATEMARALLKIAFDQLELAQLVAFTITTNQASRRVMEKVGFAFERELVHAGLPHVLYRTTRDQAIRR